MRRTSLNVWCQAVALLSVGAVHASTPPHAKTLQPIYVSRIWRTQEGLPENRIRAIAQTPDGYLWVGTSSGLARFDGVRFVSEYIEQRADFDVFLDARDVDAFVFLDGAAIDADETEPLDEWVNARAPDLGDERAGWIGFDVDFLFLIVGGLAFELIRR